MTPKFISAIDNGQQDIHVWFSNLNEVDFLGLSKKLPDFANYLSFQKRMDAQYADELSKPKDLINDYNDFGYFNEPQNYRVYPKDALKK